MCCYKGSVWRSMMRCICKQSGPKQTPRKHGELMTIYNHENHTNELTTISLLMISLYHLDTSRNMSA
eukprot:m.343064 g.343064  ORF g.343064 m.343064 type:complete len:67 (+) comp22288_c0_seq1:1571-1771(+)